jgi:hypothetical protein
MIKADLQCSSVAAASVLAKTERDAIMVRLAADHPGYGWDENKGYSTAAHTEALRRLGACVHHRQSWRLPELGEAPCDPLFEAPASDRGTVDEPLGAPLELDDLGIDPDAGPCPAPEDDPGGPVADDLAPAAHRLAVPALSLR